MSDDGLVKKGDLDPAIERVTHELIGAAIEVHREFGPGLLEGIYEDALLVELEFRGVLVERQVPMPVMYRGRRLRDLRLDIFVERCLVVELKSVQAIQEIDRSQLLSQLRVTSLPLGLLLNFNELKLYSGLHRIFNERGKPVLPFSPRFHTSSSSGLSSSSSR